VIDLRLVRDDPDRVRASQRARGEDEAAVALQRRLHDEDADQTGDEGDHVAGHHRPVNVAHGRGDDFASRKRDRARGRLGDGDAAEDDVGR